MNLGSLSNISSRIGRRPISRSSTLAAFSDSPPLDVEATNTAESSPTLGIARSPSLTTLQPTISQPRMAQLETLEAKMASIEVSLSSTPRRKKNGSLSLGSSIRSIPKELAAKELENLRNALRDKENIIQSLKGQLTVPGVRLNGIRNNNNNNNSGNMNGGSNRELSEIEKKQAEDRLNRLKTDVDNKRLAIKNLKMALERLDITDNIDVRIQQAELEYQLGREELNLLTLLEETRALQFCIEESNKNSSEAHTLYRCIFGNGLYFLQAIEVDYDVKSPKFGAGQKETTPGLWIDWALEDTGLCKNDRLVEVNGKIVLTKTRDDLTRLLAAAPDQAQLVVLRKLSPESPEISNTVLKNGLNEVNALRSELEVVRERAEEAQKVKDGLRSDNIRLTHRISYLEEQVSELLNRRPSEADIRIVTPKPVISTVKTTQNVTNINITSQKDMQVFQNAQRSKSSLSNVSNTHIPAPSPQPDFNCHKNHRHKHRQGRNMSTSNQNLDDKNHYRKHSHHHHHRDKDYNSETNSAIDVTRYNKRNMDNNHRYSGDFTKANSEREYASDVMDQSFKKATKIVHELTRNRDNLYEKHRQKCITASEKYNGDILKHYNARKSTSVLDFRSEIHIGPKYSDSKSVEDLDAIDTPSKSTNRIYKKIQDCRSVKSLDFDSDCNSISTRLHNGNTKSVDYASEPLESNKKMSYYHGYYNDNHKSRPTPPKKPLRLSLHKTQSLQSVETPPQTPHDSPTKHESRKSLKRNYRGEIPICVTIKSSEQNGDYTNNKWGNFKRGIEYSAENGSWC
ncbi:unnamed protein product [Brassicogethes aeneus]|uniref:PDZ domain-containing protein n=1 Tax=Brassicogethes aeneus TaxID=1431903 RepID=A0A9P0B3F8_BRAAE|nr:unnamed protein product [Brassicogethes aeneus]